EKSAPTSKAKSAHRVRSLVQAYSRHADQTSSQTELALKSALRKGTTQISIVVESSRSAARGIRRVNKYRLFPKRAAIRHPHCPRSVVCSTPAYGIRMLRNLTELKWSPVIRENYLRTYWIVQRAYRFS